MKPRILNMWNVIKNTETNQEILWYGSYDEFEYELDAEEKEYKWKVVPYDNWSSKNLVEIFTEELESGNYHNWIWLPDELLKTLKNNNVKEKECFNIILEIYKNWLLY